MINFISIPVLFLAFSFLSHAQTLEAPAQGKEESLPIIVKNPKDTSESVVFEGTSEPKRI